MEKSLISVTVNGEKRQTVENINLAEFVRQFSAGGEKIAVELNLQVVRRRDWESIAVNEGDKIEIIHFVGGG